MPTIMDQEFDDLFGDSAALNLAPSPPARGLRQRVDELHITGCNQKISWSKSGCIAYITGDGRSARLANLRCNSTNSLWEQFDVTDELFISHLYKIYKGRELAHLSWNPTGAELVVADVYGRLSIFGSLVALNRLIAHRAWMNDPEDNLHALVGMMWLNTDRTIIPLNRPVTKNGTRWSYAIPSLKARGPYNSHAGKPAFIAVTRSGVLRLVYQTDNNQWLDMKKEFYSLSSSLALITHATLSQDKDDSILLLIHTSSRQLRLYRVLISWFGQDQAGSTGPGMSSPTLSIRHMKVANECYPLNTESSSPTNFLMTPSTNAQLSHLELLPRGPETRNVDGALPTIVAVFSYVPQSQQFSNEELREDAFSVISRWELKTEKSTLHASFDTLASKRVKSSGAQDLEQELFLRRLEDVRSDRIVLNLQPLNLALRIAIAYSDGSVDIRDRVTFQPIPDDGPDVVSGLVTNGFGYSEPQSCLHVTLSPNCCGKAYLGVEHQPKVALLQSLRGNAVEMQDQLFVEKATVAFVQNSALACLSNSNSDDILMAMQQFMLRSEHEQTQDGVDLYSLIRRQYVCNLYQALKVDVDQVFESQPERLLRHPTIQKCLSLQAVMNSNSEKEKKTLSSKLAWTLLNIRSISLNFAYTFTRSEQTDSYHSLVCGSEWMLTLMEYIVDQLFELNRLHAGDPDTEFESTQDKTQSLNSPALALILSSSARTFLRYDCRCLRGLFNIATSHLSPADPLASHSHDLLAVMQNSRVTAQQFEKILAEVESGVKKAYQAAATPNPSNPSEIMTDAKRQEMERTMLIDGTIPDLLMPVVRHLLTTTTDDLKEEVDEAQLYFKDVSMLGLHDDRRTKRWHREHVLDAIRKVVLDKDTVKTRSCTRCGATMEDLTQSKGINPWLWQLQRACFCGGLWIVE